MRPSATRREPLLVRHVVAPADLSVDPPVTQRLLERVVVGEARRLDRSLLREDDPDAVRLGVICAEPFAPRLGVADDQRVFGTGKFHFRLIFSTGRRQH